MGKVDRLERVYANAIAILESSSDDVIFDIDSLKYKARNHLYGLELVEKYGFDIDPKSVIKGLWVDLEMRGCYGRHNMQTWTSQSSISWNDGVTIPAVGEEFYAISFPTGAYIFGDRYPTALFNDMFVELRDLGAKVSDTTNHTLWFDLKSAKAVYKSVIKIFDKYREKNALEAKKDRADQLRAELEELGA